MALEMDTGVMRERLSQFSDYLQQNFGDRVGHLLVLFNTEGAAVSTAGTDKDVLRAALTVLFEVFITLRGKYGPDAGAVIAQALVDFARDKNVVADTEIVNALMEIWK